MRVVAFDTTGNIHYDILSERVLILNRSYLPIHITSVKRAVTLLSIDAAIGVDADYNTYAWDHLIGLDVSQVNQEHFYLVKTVSTQVAVPKVLVLQNFDRRPPTHVRFSRTQIYLRDHHTCQYCGKALPKQRLNLDHVIPRSQGGKTSWENVVTSCHYCNRRKGGRTPSQAGMPLLTEPHRPSVSPLLLALKQVHTTWNSFLFNPRG